MKKIVTAIAIIISILLLTTEQALGRSEMMRWRGSEDWDSRSQYGRLYDLQTILIVVE